MILSVWFVTFLLSHSQQRSVQGKSHTQEDQEQHRSHQYIACYKPALTLCSLQLDKERSKRKNRPQRDTLADLSLPLYGNVTPRPKNSEDNESKEMIGLPLPYSSSSESLLHIVGRLDRDSEGLLLLTDDGKFTSRVLSENCCKTYWALVQGCPDKNALEEMRSGGLNIRGAQTRPPVAVNILSTDSSSVLSSVLSTSEEACKSKNNNDSVSSIVRQLLPQAVPGTDRPGTTWLEVILNEGKNRQARKITASAGHKTIRLCRVAIGDMNIFQKEISLLKPGEWKYIDKNQIIN